MKKYSKTLGAGLLLVFLLVVIKISFSWAGVSDTTFSSQLKKIDLLSFLGKPLKVLADPDNESYLIVFPPQFLWDEETGQIYTTPTQSIFLTSGSSIDEGQRALAQEQAESIINQSLQGKEDMVEAVRKELIDQLSDSSVSMDIPLILNSAQAEGQASDAYKNALGQIVSSQDGRVNQTLNWLLLNLAYRGTLGAAPKILTDQVLAQTAGSDNSGDRAPVSQKQTWSEWWDAGKKEFESAFMGAQNREIQNRNDSLRQTTPAESLTLPEGTQLNLPSTDTPVQEKPISQEIAAETGATPSPTGSGIASQISQSIISQSPPSPEEPSKAPTWRNFSDPQTAKNFAESIGYTVREGQTEGVGWIIGRNDIQKDFPDSKSFINWANNVDPTGPEYGNNFDLLEQLYPNGPGNIQDSIQAIEGIKLPPPVVEQTAAPEKPAPSASRGQREPQTQSEDSGDRSQPRPYRSPSGYAEPQEPYTQDQLIRNGWKKEEDGSYTDPFTGEKVRLGNDGFFRPPKTSSLTGSARGESDDFWQEPPSRTAGSPKNKGKKEEENTKKTEESPVQQTETLKEQLTKQPIKSDPENPNNIELENYELSPQTIDKYTGTIGYDGLAQKLGKSEYELKGELHDSYYDKAVENFQKLHPESEIDSATKEGRDVIFKAAAELKNSGRTDLNENEKGLLSSAQRAAEMGIEATKMEIAKPDLQSELTPEQLQQNLKDWEELQNQVGSPEKTLPPIPDTKAPEQAQKPQPKPEDYKDLGKDGNFDRLAECMGFKKGEIPKNGAMVGFYKGGNLDVWYLDPKTGRPIGGSEDKTGQQPLRTFPQGGGFSQSGIYAVQVQPHYHDGADTQEWPLTMRGDLRMKTDGKFQNTIYSNNIHPGGVSGCLSTGSQKISDGFMKVPWENVRGGIRPPDDDCSQKKNGKGKCDYDKHRREDTLLFATLPYGKCMKDVNGDIYKGIQTLQARKEYNGYDPQIITF